MPKEQTCEQLEKPNLLGNVTDERHANQTPDTRKMEEPVVSYHYDEDDDYDDDDSPALRSPTRRQLEFAHSLGISVPPDATRQDAATMISRVVSKGAVVSSEYTDKMISTMVYSFARAGWSEWDVSIHNVVGQILRAERALQSECMRVCQYSSKFRFAKVEGDSNSYYLVSEKGCTCPDFCKRQLPCKHMYYLASAIPNLPQTVIDTTESISDGTIDNAFKGLLFIVTGKKQKPVKEYIAKRGGMVTDKYIFDLWESITGVVMSDEAVTKRVSDMRDKNVLILTFDELKNIFPIESA